jgi:hypothetical protein
VLGIWKAALVAVTRDEGRSWTAPVPAAGLPANGSKYALQRTPDGRYALFFNPTPRLRYPLAVLTSDDAARFDDLLAVHGETPDQRFEGNWKNLGAQYVRVIAEGDGTPPDRSATWITYSVNKEDVWVSRVPTPISAAVTGPVAENFEAGAPGTLPAGWNVYSPLWAPVRIIDTVAAGLPGNNGGGPDHALELRDEEPYDYARAVRVFPETHGLRLSFKVLARQTTGRLEIELADRHGHRGFLFVLGEDGHLWACHEGLWMDNGRYAADAWITLDYALSPDPAEDRGALSINGSPARPRQIGGPDTTATVERLSFRTGPQRLHPSGGRDLPGADDKAPAAVFVIDDVTITPIPADR